MPERNQSLWYKDAIIYELHVKAFLDSNGDGRGDFRGLMQKLDYLQELGVTAIWLLPFYPSPQRDDGYDISDYRGIHPDYGTLRDFRAFVREAHRRGLKVITELVINHTSDQHPWFQAARRARRGSARRDFYVWSDTDTRFPETRIIFTDTEPSNWSWDPVAGQYYWHRFFGHQPDLNHNNPRVVREVVRVLRFWLDIGVDGLRLDAVPYLCVREGTANENLPETHEVIRRIRAELDRHYGDRMLLAEANQWPADVRPYFGDGDECHMAFHFPLMPRIFMALGQEDRRPITDIMEHTPEIPESCQWALFLRNHDELTLEMVTDQERDYMYAQYANDPRMRLNIGIRRRLAPLVGNSMRRIELLNSLLFSFPGTPVIYYGDEIGMGDNIYLGDRDGVRTPMQWSIDRNAGFSKADAARLYLPLLMDPVYGYGSINVEAQQRNPSSLLHFMRRIISLRRQHKAFGRGSMEFLHPANRKILAYLRRWRGEVILAVANLSRFVQPCELDLREFDGWTPVEMIGRTDFPPIGQLPYFLTLGPHAFYWFRLEPQARPIQAGAPGATQAAPLPRLTMEKGQDLLDDDLRHLLEQEVMPVYLARQRWFRSKAREMVGLRLTDWAKLGGGFHLLIVEIRYGDGGQESYVVPIKTVMGEAGRRLAAEIPDCLMAHLERAGQPGVVCDALADLTSCRMLHAAMLDGRQYATARKGRVRAFWSQAADGGDALEGPIESVRRLGAEQSNTSVVLDDRYILKFFRAIEPGPNPDLELGLYLTERTGFRHHARVAGGIVYLTEKARSSTVAMLQAFVPNRGDGWTWTLERMRPVVAAWRREPAAGQGLARPPAALPGPDAAGPPAALRRACGPYLEAIRGLGRRTAEFHLALAGERRLADFVPRPLTASYLQSLAGRFHHQAQQSLALLNSRVGGLGGALRERADAVLSVGPSLINRYQAVADLPGEATRIRIHGDYHLGQVLRVEDDWVLLDFEGEPLRPLAERREKYSPLKDVAGLLRSLSYAAWTLRAEAAAGGGADGAPGGAPAPDDGPTGWLAAWEAWAADSFLRGYLEAAGEAPFLPRRSPDLQVLLDAYLLDKSFYELAYELNNRPAWVGVPLDGILALARREGGSSSATAAGTDGHPDNDRNHDDDHDHDPNHGDS